jgi:large subunit ribosomal protein L9
MKVILLEDVAGKGKAGDVVKVNDGFARNYLVPREMAILANATNMKNLEHRRAKLAEQRARNLEEAQQVKARLDGVSINLTATAGEGGRLFGSITSQDIADSLDSQHSITIDKRKIQLDAHIKEIGIHPVDIKLFPEVTATIRVVVATESGATSVAPPVTEAPADEAEADAETDADADEITDVNESPLASQPESAADEDDADLRDEDEDEEDDRFDDYDYDARADDEA